MMKKTAAALLLGGILGAASLSYAAMSPEALRSEAIAIAKELRCPSSLNQSLLESEKPIASELKAKIYQLLEEGKTREEIFRFFAERYGEKIRYEPVKDGSTAILWLAPAALLCIFGGVAFRLQRQRRRQLTQKEGKDEQS
jgi:cytochrome c-type biogenesis protein CcmH